MPVVNADPHLHNKSVVLWDNRSISALGASSAPGYPAINTLDPATWNSWRANTLANNFITYTLDGVQWVNSVAISSHTIFSSGASLEIRISTDDVSYTPILSYTPTSDEDLIFMFKHVQASHVRIAFTGGMPNLGVVFSGRTLIFPCTPVDSYTPLHHSRRYTKQFTTSIKGQFLGNRVMGAGAQTDVQFPAIPRDFVDSTDFLGFEKHYNQGGTFFYAGWPNGKPQDMGYCRAGGQDDIVGVEYIESDKMATVNFSLDSYVTA